jgi:hypothetical protein
VLPSRVDALEAHRPSPRCALPYNVPSNIVTNNISVGPGTIAMGPSGATPTIDVGAIGDDGVAFEITSEKLDVMQGNPATIEHSFNVKQGVKLTFNGIEWNHRLLQYALGAGVTSESASLHTFTFGGTPTVTTVAIQMTHQMAAGQTILTRVWKARGDGAVSIQLGQETHKFPNAYQAMRSSTNWAGANLANTDQLLQMVRQIT